MESAHDFFSTLFSLTNLCEARLLKLADCLAKSAPTVCKVAEVARFAVDCREAEEVRERSGAQVRLLEGSVAAISLYRGTGKSGWA